MRPLQYPKPTNNSDLDGFLRELQRRIDTIQKLDDLPLTATLEEVITQLNAVKNMEA